MDSHTHPLTHPPAPLQGQRAQGRGGLRAIIPGGLLPPGSRVAQARPSRAPIICTLPGCGGHTRLALIRKGNKAGRDSASLADARLRGGTGVGQRLGCLLPPGAPAARGGPARGPRARRRGARGGVACVGM